MIEMKRECIFYPDPINLSSIGNAIDTDARTISSWINILEESYITFRLKPFAGIRNMRYSKTPKLYFYDTGLLCNLMEIKKVDDLFYAKKRGVIFENAVILSHYKNVYNEGGFPGDNTFFWRDASNHKKEVDLIIEYADHLNLYEIKSTQTAKQKHADNLSLFERRNSKIKCNKTVIYDGPYGTSVHGTTFMNRNDFIKSDIL